VKREEAIRRIRREAKRKNVEWHLDHEGGRHSIFRLGETMIPIPRHVELGERFAEEIFKECEGEFGTKWWRL